MAGELLALLLSITILLVGSPSCASILEQRIDTWPDWSLPAPLPTPKNNNDIFYPNWFKGNWLITSYDLDASQDSPTIHKAKFIIDSNGRLIGDRPFNANSIGHALLGDKLISVKENPDSANRQITLLSNNFKLETTVTGRLQESKNEGTFLADELVFQILHGTISPRISQIETLSRYEACGKYICAKQLQARYQPPGKNLKAVPVDLHQYWLIFRPLPESSPST